MSSLAVEGIQTCILTKDGLYTLIRYKNESELEGLIVKNAKQVFGGKSIYFDVKKKVQSKVKGRITDGLILDLQTPKSPKFWIVENELSRHDMYRTVEPQIRGFLRALKHEETIAKMRTTIYDEIRNNIENTELFKSVFGNDTDIYYQIDKMLHGQVGVIVVIDERTPELDEVIEDLGEEVRVIEFKTYKKDGKFIHSFTPLSRLEQEKKKIHRMWDGQIKWTHPETKQLTETFIQKIEAELPNVIHIPRYKWYSFYTTEPKVRRNEFTVLLLGKRVLNACIRIDLENFSDPTNITRPVAGFFFPKGTERRLKVTLENIERAVELVKQSYEITRRGKK